MADNNNWFNRVGRVAPLSNPGSATPNYGLTYDLATAPYDGPDHFDAIAEAISSYAQSLVPFNGGANDGPAPHQTLWDRATGAAGFVGNQVAGGLGAVKYGVLALDQHMPEFSQLDETKSGEARHILDEGHSWGDLQALGKDAAASTAEEISKAPVAKQLFWGLDQANEYASTAMVAGTLSEDNFSKFFKAGTWGDAHALTKDRHLNAGEAFMQMFYDKELLLDEDRFEQMRTHNTVFNVGALTFNVVAAWKADPNVLLGKGIGASRDLAVGKLAKGTQPTIAGKMVGFDNARTQAVQRDILGSKSLDEAKAKAEGYSGVADKLRAVHAVSLYDRSQLLREAALTQGFEQFSKNMAFKSSASGVTMAKLMQDVAADDDAWNLVFRSAIGDPNAIPELIARQSDLSDKISAIELKTMPRLQRDLEKTEARYQKRLAEQGKPQDARIELTRFGDKWLDDELTSLKAELDDASANLAEYASHESWLQRALPGLDEDSGIVGSTAPNTIYNALDRVGSRPSMQSLGGKIRMWQHDDYSPVSWVFRAPTKPNLKRVGVVSLNDVDDGAHAIHNYLDQLDHLRGFKDQALRDQALGDFAGATTDMQRKAIAESVQRRATLAIGEKHGLSPAIMDLLNRELKTRRGKVWGNMSDTTLYSPIPGKEGPGYVSIPDEHGNIQRIKMPVDPTQLSNYHPLVNLTDLDRTIRTHRDVLRDFDKDLASHAQASRAKASRRLREFSDFVGSSFNSYWKPMALISLRWPVRVVADESMRVMLLAGVLPHLAHAAEGSKNMLWNNGVVRPYEWWAGRKVKTGSLSEESLRGVRTGYDDYDYRSVVNPTAAVPVDSLDFGKMDARRYDRLNATASERWGHLRSIEADRFRATTTPVAQPRWMSQWDEKLAQAEESGTRGFFFDPLNPGKTVNKGFAVSPYPARMKTFAKRPTARELNYWVEKNSDVLAVPNTRTAVWLDRDTGRWHLDAVKVVKRREDAMLLASKAEAPEFYDIEDGFTRYLSEDFYGHFNSPFVKPETGPGVANANAAADEAGSAIGSAVRIPAGPSRRKVGFGEQTWRSADGRVVKGERVFGPDEAHSNIYYSVVSSKGAIQNLFGGYTKGIGADRASRVASDYKYFDPDDPGTNIDEWAAAYADFVNNHVRYSPIGQRMLAGKSDEQIFDWLMGTAAGRRLRQRIPTRGQNPAQWVADSREIFDHVFPSEKALMAAREGDLTPQQVLDILPEGERPFIHGDSFKLGLGTSDTHRKVGKVVDGIMDYLAAMPTDALVRHPFAQTVYNREMRNYLSSVKAEDVTQNVLHAAEASARAKAVREVRRTLYNIADEREGVHMLRFVSPFFQAQLEVLERWARISMEKPEALARLAQLFVGSQTINTPLWQVTDQEGKPVDGYHADNVVHFQVTPLMRQVAKKLMPGDPLKYADEVTIGASSLNLITAGEKPYMPSLGPLVTVPASEFYFKDRPELEDKFVYQWMFPFGAPKGRTAWGRFSDAMLPAWAKRLKTAESADFDDSAFARRVSEIGAQMEMEWEQGGREGPRPTGEQALEAAKNEYRLRAASSFFLPVPLTPRSPYQEFIELYRQYQERFGDQADEKFYDEVGPTYFMFAQQATQSAGMGPNVGEKVAYDKYKKLAQQAPDMLGVLTGPFATDEFSDAVYQWQLATRVSPDSDTRLREHLDPSERIANMEIARGWVEYTKLSSALDAELRNRVAQGGSPYITASSNADLAAIKSSKWREIVDRNPAWQDAYNSRQSHMGDWLGQAYQVAFDHSLDDRTDIQGLRTYLISRARLQDALIQRQVAGISSSAQLSFDPMGNPIGDNADLGYAWMSYINELKGQNPLFAEIYTRYLEGDDLSTYISPEVSGG